MTVRFLKHWNRDAKKLKVRRVVTDWVTCPKLNKEIKCRVSCKYFVGEEHDGNNVNILCGYKEKP